MKKKLLLLFSAIILIVAGICGGRYFLNKAERTILAKARAAGLELTYTDLHWRFNSYGLGFENLQVSKKGMDSVFSVQFNSASLDIGWSNIFNGSLEEISRISLEEGWIEVNDMDQLMDMGGGKKSVKGWSVSDFKIRDITVSLQGNTRTHFHIGAFTGSLRAKHYVRGLRYSVMKRPFKLSLDSISVDTLFRLHGMEMDAFTYDMAEGEMRFSGLRIKPTASREFIDRTEPRTVLHVILDVPEIVISGFEWSHEEEFRWHAQKILIREPRYDAYQNCNKILNEPHEKMPFALIDSLATRFLIDSVQVVKGYLHYSLSDAEECGRVWCDNWDMLCLGFGNDAARPASLTLQARMRWMETSWLDASVIVPYGDPDCNFYLKGKSGPLDFAAFNPMFGPTEKFVFASGHCHGAEFAFNGNNYSSAGKLLISFDDVKIGNPGRKMKMSTRVLLFGANLLMIRSSTHGEIVETRIAMLRDPRRGVPNFWINSLRSGLAEALKGNSETEEKSSARRDKPDKPEKPGKPDKIPRKERSAESEK